MELFPKLSCSLTCGTVTLVGYKEPTTKFSLAMKAWKTLQYSLHAQVCKAASANKNMSFKSFEKEADQVDDFADASAFVGASECAAKLLDEAALSEEAKVELNRFMVSNPTKIFFASSRLCANSMNLFCQAHASLH